MLIYEHNALKVILDTYCKYVKTEIIGETFSCEM